MNVRNVLDDCYDVARLLAKDVGGVYILFGPPAIFFGCRVPYITAEEHNYHFPANRSPQTQQANREICLQRMYII